MLQSAPGQDRYLSIRSSAGEVAQILCLRKKQSLIPGYISELDKLRMFKKVKTPAL